MWFLLRTGNKIQQVRIRNSWWKMIYRQCWGCTTSGSLFGRGQGSFERPPCPCSTCISDCSPQRWKIHKIQYICSYLYPTFFKGSFWMGSITERKIEMVFFIFNNNITSFSFGDSCTSQCTNEYWTSFIWIQNTEHPPFAGAASVQNPDGEHQMQGLFSTDYGIPFPRWRVWLGLCIPLRIR